MSVSPEALPVWDIAALPYDPSTPSFDAALDALAAALRDLDLLLAGDDASDQPAEDAARRFVILTTRYSEALDFADTLATCIDCVSVTDAGHELARQRRGDLDPHLSRLQTLQTVLNARIVALDAQRLLAESRIERQYALIVSGAVQSVVHELAPDVEELAASLSAVGGRAWEALRNQLVTRSRLILTSGDAARALPLSAARGLAQEPDRDTRKAAYAAELSAWESMAAPLAAALNAIKGEALTLATRRGWRTPLDETLAAQCLDQDTLDALLRVVRELLPAFQSYLCAKAHVLGLKQLAWFDLFAPIGDATWPFPSARELVLTEFAAFTPRLGDLAARAFDQGWIDAAPRSGKHAGGLCMALRGDESRILLTYRPTYEGVRSLAHELGHAYHFAALSGAGRTALHKHSTPWVMMETAAIFCETLARDGALRGGSFTNQLAVLEATLQYACRFVVDVYAAFRFEKLLFERRADREPPPAELCDLMRTAQREAYGDALDPQALHPYMWADKPHAFMPHSSYASVAYMFGQLFALSLYARYRARPDGFADRFDALLAATGDAAPAVLAARFRFDLYDADFWRGGADLIRADIDRFHALVHQLVPAGATSHDPVDRQRFSARS